MFQSSTVLIHLLRGCLGFGLFGLSFYLFSQGLFLPKILGIISAISWFVVLRGCPACWIIGLIHTISNSGRTCDRCVPKK